MTHLTSNDDNGLAILEPSGITRMTYDLQTFGLRDMIDAGRRLRESNLGAHCMEKAAVTVIDFFYENLRAANLPGNPSNCVLARCFKTHPYGDLPASLRRRTSTNRPDRPLAPDTQCLTLLATRGQRSEWNSRHSSSSHQAIALPTVEMVSKAPMISQLVLQLGIKLEHVVSPATRPDQPPPTFNVFHVEHALGSNMIPAQEEFVRPFGVQSVVGFGGLLPAGELFAVILFTRVTISPETASLFRTLALCVKLTLLPFSGKQVFAEG